MRFVKMHGTGNDFVVMRAEGDEYDWPSLAGKLCDRHFGIGADGIILVLPSQIADVRMRIFNPDGSEAEMCGNGIRCLAKFAVEHGLVKPENGTVNVETMAGLRPCQIIATNGVVERVRVGMGEPRFSPQAIGVLAEMAPVKDLKIDVDGHALSVTCVSMGNPHAVHFTDRPVADFPLLEIGPRIERHHLFPNRVNFEVARVLSRERMEVRVWERGAGPTLACGTGACAAVVAARLHGLVDDSVEVELPGGSLTIEWDGQGEVQLTGPAVSVYEGHWLHE